MNQNQDKINYLESKIISLRSRLLDDYQPFIDEIALGDSERIGDYERHEFEAVEGYLKEEIMELANQLYRCILLYFYAQGFTSYAEDFKEYIGKELEEDFVFCISDMEHGMIPQFPIVVDRFIAPFEAFNNEAFYNIENYGHKYFKQLTNILKNTKYILELTHTEYKNEADIYKPVRKVIELIYPSAHVRRHTKSQFFRHTKEYVADIIIPEINAVIEYKYLKDDKKPVDDILDQILVDSVNYVGDSRFKNFFGVIYNCTRGKITEEAIMEIARSKKLPRNWRIIPVKG